MNNKRLTGLLAMLGGWFGGYIPNLWGAGGFTFSSLIFSAFGALIGIWVAFKLLR